MLRLIDNFLDSITMYRLVLYELIILIGVTMVYGLFHLVPYLPQQIVVSACVFAIICYITNKLFAYVYKVPANVESVYITALILTLITQPIHSPHDIIFIGWLAVWSMASKYIFAIRKKHLFNPAAFAAVLCSLFLGQSVNWWVGTSAMVPFILVLGLLIVRKLQREDLIFSFFLSAIVTVALFLMSKGSNLTQGMQTIMLNSSLLFFGFVMLTEPLTTPPTKRLQILYGLLVGILFAPQIHIGPVYSTPELALVVGNIFSYLVSPKQKLVLHLKKKIQIGLDQIDFVFTSPERLQFTPGQYMEWTLQHKNTDSRGNRRYFTVASSPTEADVHIGIKFYPHGSSFKRALSSFSDHEAIVAGQLAGDFTLPKDNSQKIVCIAGGIGITPFRSMVKYLLDTNRRWDIVLVYSNTKQPEIMYKDIFDSATTIGVRTVYTLTNKDAIPRDWTGYTGRISQELIQKEIPDYMDRIFYLSGPHAMVTGFKKTLFRMGIHRNHIKEDFFPGFV